VKSIRARCTLPIIRPGVLAKYVDRVIQREASYVQLSSTRSRLTSESRVGKTFLRERDEIVRARPAGQKHGPAFEPERFRQDGVVTDDRATDCH